MKKLFDWFKNELKHISDWLIIIAIILIFTASWQYTKAGKDPCSYCIIKTSPDNSMSCREYFNLYIKTDNSDDYNLDNITLFNDGNFKSGVKENNS